MANQSSEVWKFNLQTLLLSISIFISVNLGTIDGCNHGHQSLSWSKGWNIIISFGKYTELLTHLGSMHSLISWRKANGNHRHLSSFKLQFPGNSKFLTNSILQHHFSRSIYRPVGPGPVLFQSTDLVFERLRYLPRDHRMCAPIHQLTTNLHT